MRAPTGRALLLALLVHASAAPGARAAQDGDGGGAEASPDGEPSDDACLRFLAERKVPFRAAAPVRGVRTPVELGGPLGGVRLVPRARRPPLMDCELLRALAEAVPVLAEAGISELSYSGAYDFRSRRGSNQLSAHARGLAIDVHAFRGPAGWLDVTRDFEAGAGTWRGLVPQAGDIAGCIGAPRTEAGRRLRTLVCRLKHHSAFRVIVTPDDNDDHRDHVHFEAFPDAATRVARVLGVLPLRR
jgi:hypothetical protein